MFHGRGPDPVGGAGPQRDGDWLVQAVPYLLDGGPDDGAAHPSLISDVSGEHHRAVLWQILIFGRRWCSDANAKLILKTFLLSDAQQKDRPSVIVAGGHRLFQ